MMGGSWFRVRQILFLLLLFTTLMILWKAFDTSSITEARDYSMALTDAPVNMQIEVLGLDEGGSKRGEKAKAQPAIPETSCRIPKLDINGSEVISFFKKPIPLPCNKNAENWVYIDDDAKFTLIAARKGAVCMGIPFTRVTDGRLARGEKVQLKEGEPLPSDYVSVVCNTSNEKWEGLLMSVVPSKDFISKMKAKAQPTDWSGLNVYFLGFDSLSQMSFRRQLPKTVQFLEKELGSVVLDGYNIVGDGTPQAFIPILTGQTEVELPLTRKRFKNANYVDDVYPFLWRNFSDAGYATLYGEDAAAIGTFTYRLKGFRHQPTDHYTRTFFQEAEKILSDMKCLGSEPLHKSWLRYAEEFMDGYSELPRFLVMHHSMLSHDDINQVAVIDDDVLAHLTAMKEGGFFEHSVVIVMADHGHRFAKLRETHQGQLEERLPFFSIALPQFFGETTGKKALANLRANAERLTSPFDIHATLLDLLHWPSEQDLETEQDASKIRSLSLFRPIPVSRSCAQAGIEPHWCTCLDWQDAMKTEEDKKQSMEIARAIVQTMNGATEKERSLCAPLTIKQLVYAKKLVPNANVMAYKNVKDADGFVPDLTGSTRPAFAHYQLKIATQPGRALYEVTVSYNYRENRLVVDLAAVSHVNKYGDDPHCIIDKNYFLATYCVCYDRLHSTD